MSKIEEWRKYFENQPIGFYGGNNLQRDGEGYASSYVNMKWELWIEILNQLEKEKANE